MSFSEAPPLNDGTPRHFTDYYGTLREDREPVLLTCLVCGAVVALGVGQYAQRHLDWHRRMDKPRTETP